MVQCVPAPPQDPSTGFDYDILRYMWGKQQRRDPDLLDGYACVRCAVTGPVAVCAGHVAGRIGADREESVCAHVGEGVEAVPVLPDDLFHCTEFDVDGLSRPVQRYPARVGNGAAAVMPGSIQFQTFMHGITNVFRTFIPAIVPKQPTVVFLVAENAGLITGQSIEITCGRFN